MINIANDKLNRQEFIHKLFSLFENFGNQGDKGLTVILNGKYGSGKSTLLSFIEQRNQTDPKFQIVKYDAWNNNLFENPLIPILYEITKLEKKSSKIKEGAKKVIKSIPQVLLSTLANVHGADLTALLPNDNIFTEYDEYRESLDKFRGVLKEYCDKQKVLFLIDELDRCLPEYQIKVLEAIYHLLDIPNLIVVIAIDRNQLEHSIRNKFGNNLNVLGYLSKFIDYQVDLPEDNDNLFIQSLMNFECEHSEYIKPFIANIFKVIKYSIRDCQKIVSEINLITNSVGSSGCLKTNYKYWYPPLVAMILIIKYEDENIYRDFLSKQKKDYYSDAKIKFNETLFYDFIEKSKGTKIELIINYLLKSNESNEIAKLFLLDFMNCFVPVNCIDKAELLAFLGEDEEFLNYAYRFGGRISYPYTINDTMLKIQSLNF